MNISPKQPFFVMATMSYYKSVVMNYGISHFYCFQKEKSLDHAIMAVPDGCIDILFCCDSKNPYAEICGTVLRPTLTNINANSYFFGVRFLPGQTLKFKNAKMTDIIEREIPLLEVIESKELIEKITSSRDFNYQINAFFDFYMKLYSSSLLESGTTLLKNYILRRIIETTGSVKVNELADETGYSTRYINKIFLENMGIAPKVFSKIIRFQNLLSNLNTKDPDISDANLAQIASDFGYFDQSHMINDFYELSSTTPGKYLHFLKETDYNKRIIIV